MKFALRSVNPNKCDLTFCDCTGRAHALINGDYTNAAGKEGYAIWEFADELELEIGEWADKLRKVSVMLDKLVMLAPEEE